MATLTSAIRSRGKIRPPDRLAGGVSACRSSTRRVMPPAQRRPPQKRCRRTGGGGGNNQPARRRGLELLRDLRQPGAPHRAGHPPEHQAAHPPEHETEPSPPLRPTRPRSAELLRMAFAVDAAVSRRRGGKMRIAALMTAHAVATRTLARLERRGVHPRGRNSARPVAPVRGGQHAHAASLARTGGWAPARRPDRRRGLNGGRKGNYARRRAKGNPDPSNAAPRTPSVLPMGVSTARLRSWWKPQA